MHYSPCAKSYFSKQERPVKKFRYDACCVLFDSVCYFVSVVIVVKCAR